MDESLIYAPEFPEGLTWLNTDRPLRIREELRGQVIILDFWTYCCINCLHVLHELEYLEEKYARDPVVIIGVHSNKYTNEANPRNIREAILRYEVSHPVVVDTNHTIWDAYTVNAWPTLMVIDTQGRVLGALPGEGHREELDRVIAALLEIGRDDGTLAAGPLHFPLEKPDVTVSGLSFPGKILVDRAGGRLFIADTNNNRILVTGWDGDVRHLRK